MSARFGRARVGGGARVALGLALLAPTVTLTVAPRHAGAQPVAGVRVGASRTPDTVRVGDPVRVLLRVAAPAGARVEFPAAADTAAPIEVIGGPRQHTNAAAGGGIDVTAEYTIAAWTVGAVPIALDSVTVRVGNTVRRVAMPSLAVTVRSVLPVDSTQRTPKPPREPLPDVGLWWLRYALLPLGLLAVAGVLALLARRRLRRAQLRRVTGDDPYARVLAGFDALDRRGLLALGEGGRHVALAVDLLREYLVARLPDVARPSQTSGELLAALAPDTPVPVGTLGDVLGAGDLVKFAAVPIAPEHATRVAADARAVVETTEAAIREREAAAAAAAAERARAEAEERRAYEEARRRAARASRSGPPPTDRPPTSSPPADPSREDRAA